MPSQSLPGLLLFLLLATRVLAADGDDDRRQFLRESFPGGVPKAQLIWFSGELRQQASDLLGHRPRSLRQRYWLAGRRSAWVIDEVGKERPITFGVVIDDGRIERLEVLAFRESRGGEIRHAFYTDQYREAGLNDDNRLDRGVDGITGATLSHRAANKASRLALILHRQVVD